MWNLVGRQLKNRLIIGTARYSSPQTLLNAIQRSKVEIVTISLRRMSVGLSKDLASGQFFQMLRSTGVDFLPNTAFCRSAREAVITAQMSREIFGTNWIKLETVGDESTLQPDPFALVEAARILVAEGFEVFPYTTEDLVVNERLLAAGCRILMPWGAPIGSGRGLANVWGLKNLRQRFPEVTLIVDAGIGAPSHAAQAMELGFDGVLLNTAVSQSNDPPAMAEAFAIAVQAGRMGYEAGLMESQEFAVASSPTQGLLFSKTDLDLSHEKKEPELKHDSLP